MKLRTTNKKLIAWKEVQEVMQCSNSSDVQNYPPFKYFFYLKIQKVIPNLKQWFLSKYMKNFIINKKIKRLLQYSTTVLPYEHIHAVMIGVGNFTSVEDLNYIR